MKNILFALLLCSSLLRAAEPELLTFTPQNANGCYQAGEKIVWKVNVKSADAATLKEVPYTIKSGGLNLITQGKLDLSGGSASVETSFDKPNSILLDLTLPGKDTAGKEIHAQAGAMVAPDKIEPSTPRPADFDEFWNTKIAELAKIPENAQLEKGESGKPNVDYWKIQLDNIKGSHVYGQLARPVITEADKEKKLPAMLVLQYAGVYGLPKGNVTGPAAEGWLVLNIMPHDLPFDQPESFYKEQGANALKGYTAIGNDDREQSYFLRMFLGCYRAVEYLSKRPDWDGKTLLVIGTSQGGLQSIVSAGFNPKVTCMMVNVPAGCDNTATSAASGRAAGWPYWMASAGGKDQQKALETSKYFDAVNFAYHVKCPALVGAGLIDLTARPAGIYAGFNLFTGPKEIVPLVNSDHHGNHNAQAPYHARATAWRKALLAGQEVPAK